MHRLFLEALIKQGQARSRLWLYLPLRRCLDCCKSDENPSFAFAWLKYSPTKLERLVWVFWEEPNNLDKARDRLFKSFMPDDLQKYRDPTSFKTREGFQGRGIHQQYYGFEKCPLKYSTRD